MNEAPPDSEWPPTTPAARPPLGRRDIHVWRIGLKPEPPAPEALRQLLDDAELERADRFRFAKDRLAFTVSHGALRTILGSYMQQDPHHIRYRYGPDGKPALVDGPAPAGRVQFNLSHSGALALVAIAHSREVGIDIEHLGRRVSDDMIPERFFSPREVAALRALPAAQQRRAFFDCWTRKEAFIKAIGAGLKAPLDQFDVSLAPDRPAELLAVRWDAKEAARWRMTALDAGPDYAAALIAESGQWRLTRLEWRQASPVCYRCLL